MTTELILAVDQPAQVRQSKEIVQRALALTGQRAKIVDVVPATLVKGLAKPKIAEVRDHQEAFLDALEASGVRRILAMGGIALQGLLHDPKKVPLTEHRGRMFEGVAGRPGLSGALWVPTGTAGGVLAWPDMFTDTVDDVWKLLNQDAPIPTLMPDDGRVDWRRDSEPSLAYDALGEFDGATVISCDIETTGLSPWRDRLVSVGFGASYGDGTSLVRIVRGADALWDPDVMDRMWDLIFSKSHVTVFHNAKFDIQWLLKHFDMKRTPSAARFADTMLLHHQLDERPIGKMAGSVHSLKTLARVYYDQPDYSMDHAAWWQKEAAGILTEKDWFDYDWYHARDCHFTIQLWGDLTEQASTQMPGAVEFHHALLGRASGVIAGCELRGIPLDVHRATEIADEMKARMEKVKARLLSDPLLDDTDWGPAGEELNLGSPDAVRRLLMDPPPVGWGLPPQEVTKAKTKAGQADKTGSTDMTHLRALRRWCEANDRQAESDWIGALLDYRQDMKDTTSFLDPLVEAAYDHGTGPRVHASFWLAGTVTGRLSSSNPSVQNMPGAQSAARGRGRIVKHAFKPPEGWSWLECDYSQLELRIAAALTGDPGLLEAFTKGLDLHRIVAATMYQKAEEDVNKAERFTAKAIDFGILYGRSAWAISKDEEIARMLALGDPPKPPPTAEEAEVFIDRFLSRFPLLRAWLDEIAHSALTKGYVPIGSGRRRRFTYQNKDRSDWRARKHQAEIARQARNGPIQGLASDTCLDAMCRLEAVLPEEGVELLFPVHDSICMIVRDDLKETVISLAKEVMSQPPSWYDMKGVPLAVDAKSGPSWGESGDL